MKTVILFAAHFPPSNLAGVHRARLWAQHLHEFGWRPIVVTTHWRYYEEQLDWQLCDLIEPSLEIIRTRGLSTKPVRIIGDIGIRGLPWHVKTLRQLFRDREIDFLHITIPSFYSALLGELLYRKSPIAFGIDYIDPWVHLWPEAPNGFGKARISMWLGSLLEPWAVRNASLITGVAKAYFSGVLNRNPNLVERCVVAEMPYGNSANDFDAALRLSRRPYLFDSEDGAFHFVYAGAMLPRAYSVLDRLFAALLVLRGERPEVFNRMRFHFIGTGKAPNDAQGHNILPIARKLGLEGIIFEYPQRVSYVDVLAHLVRASAILILGSTEPHYTPSKVYQSVQAKRPILALLHEHSTAVEVLESSKAGVVVKFNESALPDATDLARRLANFVASARYDEDEIDWSCFEKFSSRESARKLAAALDAALQRFLERGS